MTRLIAYGLAGVALVAILWWVQSRIRVSYQAEQQRDAAVANLATFRRSVEQEARRAAEQQAVDRKEDQALTARLDALRGENEALSRALRRAASTVERPREGTTCPVISHHWGVCFAASIGRDPADVAACKAGAGDAGVPDSH